MEIGRTFGDDWASVPFLIGILCLVGASGRSYRDVIGGVLIGAAAGLKMTNLPLAAAFFVAFAIAFPRLRRLLALARTMALGMLMASGWSLLFNYQHFGNPVFPFYNAIFHSPLFPPINFYDLRWQLPDLRHLAWLPIEVANGTTTVTEGMYRETHWLALLALLAVALVYGSARLLQSRPLNFNPQRCH